jgi:hypothetical protein
MSRSARCVDPFSRAVDVEWRAFDAGVKPAIRVSAAPDQAGAIFERYRSRGASVARSEPVMLRGERSVILYVARSLGEANELRDQEARLLGRPSRRERGALPFELGLRLGYPRCCVAGFVRRNHGGLRSWLSAIRERKLGHDCYLGARDACVPRPNSRVNPLLLPERRTFISFDPCRYDCPEAIGVAERIAAVICAADAEWAGLVDRELARPIVVDSGGARAHVDLGRGGDALRILGAEPPRGQRGETRDTDRRLAAALVGCLVDRRSLVRCRSGFAPPVLIDFSGAPLWR